MYDETKKRINNKNGGVVSVNQFEDYVTPMQLEYEYQEAVSIFPALHKYKNEHNTTNLRKLCVEVQRFCQAIYASTQNKDERDAYHDILDKIAIK